MSLVVLIDMRVSRLRVYFHTSKSRAVADVSFDPNFPKRGKLKMILKYGLENIELSTDFNELKVDKT